MLSKEILTMRAMAWERAKGELQSYLQTFWDEYDDKGRQMDEVFNKSDVFIKQFIAAMEDLQ